LHALRSCSVPPEHPSFRLSELQGAAQSSIGSTVGFAMCRIDVLHLDHGHHPHLHMPLARAVFNAILGPWGQAHIIQAQNRRGNVVSSEFVLPLAEYGSPFRFWQNVAGGEGVHTRQALNGVIPWRGVAWHGRYAIPFCS
jgi:hypothetical protein